jgi:putative restriction endonuclease
MNGAADFETMLRNITALRRADEPSPRDGSFKIGCIMITAPVFFKQDEWIAPPNDWARTGIQQGKTYSIHQGEGRRVFEECVLQAQSGNRYWNVEERTPIVAEDSARFGKAVLVKPRLGQGTFSLAVRDAYKGACAVTQEHSIPVLEAAHIQPYSQGGHHRVDNGLMLRRDVHRLYDLGYVTITPDYIFRVGDRLRDEYGNGRVYKEMEGRVIAVPDEFWMQPDRELLEWHATTLFKG